jgi:hypothetical protein
MKWREAIEYWEKVPEALRKSSSVWTYAGIARAYRKTGNPVMAHEIARGAASQFPSNDQLEREIVLCRPAHIDWPHSLISVAASTAETSPVAGFVDELGFLAGGTEPLVGRLGTLSEVSHEVQLWVNELSVASTSSVATSDQQSLAAFSINCADLLQFLGDGDIIRVTSEGRLLMLPKLGPAAMVYCGTPSRFSALERAIRQGHVFTKFGHLRPGHTDESKCALLDFYNDVSSRVQSETGLPMFPFYGTLLGAIRENDFIAHDVGGFDTVIVCSSREPLGVRAEFIEICRLLLEWG